MSPIFQHRAHGTGEYGSQSGFNIIELMVVMAIITIMATVAIPSFMTMSRDNRLAMRHNDFLGTLNLARNEAITRGTSVTICKWDDDDEYNKDGCNDTEWEKGWIVFVDINRDDKVNSEEVIRVYPPLKKPNTLRGINTAEDQIDFNSRGMLSGSGTLTFCDSRSDDPAINARHARGLIISRSGQSRVARDSDDDGIRDNNGANLVCPS